MLAEIPKRLCRSELRSMERFLEEITDSKVGEKIDDDMKIIFV